MANNNYFQKSNKGVQFGKTITPRSKVGGATGVVEPKSPPSGKKVNLYKPETAITHDKIAERAFIIWQNRGCIPGEDERNWLEAEAQLRSELDID